MDGPLRQRFDSGDRPFQDGCLRPAEFIAWELVRPTMEVLVDGLANRFPSSQLVKLDDWHQHDGYLCSSAPTSWAELRLATASEQTLLATQPDDDEVRVAIYSADFEFLIRYYLVYEPLEPDGCWGDFDVCGSRALLLQLKADLATSPRTASASLILEDAKPYFDRIDAT